MICPGPYESRFCRWISTLMVKNLTITVKGKVGCEKYMIVISMTISSFCAAGDVVSSSFRHADTFQTSISVFFEQNGSNQFSHRSWSILFSTTFSPEGFRNVIFRTKTKTAIPKDRWSMLAPAYWFSKYLPNNLLLYLCSLQSISLRVFLTSKHLPNISSLPTGQAGVYWSGITNRRSRTDFI